MKKSKVAVCMWTTYVTGAQGGQKSVKSPRFKVMDGCELHVGTGCFM